MRPAVCISAIAILGLNPLFSQEFRATISGEVTDPAGAVVEGAKVVATNVERNIPYEATSNSAGRYTIQFVEPGMYTLTVEQTGFKKFVRQGLRILSADRIGIDVNLELGAVSDAVTVTGEAPLLQTESASRTSTVENRIMENVPSGGRNLYALEYSQPGVLKTSNYWGSMELYASGNVNGVQISGGRSGENESVVDGITTTQSSRGIAFVPSINSTQEFTIRTNNYDAQYGRVGGGVTQITVKSGTNSPHGQLFEYLKNDKLFAGDWAANAAGEVNQSFKNNTFGFEIDGPFYIPKILDGRNKAFFMISMEGLREHSAGTQITTLPYANQLKGDFSQTFNDSGQLVQIYDPTSTRLGPDGKTYIRTPFSGNMIPPSLINPVAAKAASYYPAPNIPGNGLSHQDNYVNALPQVNAYDSWLGKMDYHFSSNSRVSLRYGQTPWSNWAKRVFNVGNPAEPSGEWPTTRIFRTWGADWTYVLSPSLIFNLRGGLSRYEGSCCNLYGRNYDPTQLGFPTSLVSQFTAYQFPYFNMGNYSALGTSSVISYGTDDSWSLQPNMSWTRGRHLLRFGAEFRLYNDNSISPGSASGAYNFDKTWTQANPQRGDAASGNEIASFLLGYPQSGSVARNIDPAYQSKYYATFVQDDFKVSPKLTLNLGLRWDYESPRVERYDRMIRGFDFNAASPIAGKVQGLNLKGGLLYAGVNGQPRGAFDPSRANFQPRVGVAYHLRPKVVLRGGYGLSYLGQNANGPATGYSQPTNLIASTDSGLTPAVTLSNPFPSNLFPSGLLKPIGNSQGLATNLGLGASFQYLDRPLPYSHQYSAGVQYELRGDWMLDVSYVGNQTRRLPVGLNLNFLSLDTLNSIPVDQRTAYFTQQVPNPMAGLLPNSAINGATVSRQQLLYAFPQYNGVSVSNVPIGSQRYDSLQLQVTHRFGKGLALQVGYNISKGYEQVAPLNAQDVNLSNLLDTKLEKRLIQYDVPQQLQVIGTYDFPFGKGRHWLSSMNPVLNGIVGGWTFSGQWQTHSGYPFDFPNAAPLAARSAKLSDSQRDALAQQAGRPQFDVSYDKWFDVTLFPKVAGPAPYTLRNFPTRFPDVRGKPLNIGDFSLYKEFPMKERLRWQFRVDAHNAANWPWFASLRSNSVTNSGFGQLRPSMGNEVRVVVIVLKLFF